MTHMSHLFTFTARKSGLLRGEPWKSSCFQLSFICYFLDAYIKHGYLWKVPKGVPFSSQILHRPHNDNMFQLMVVEVGSSEGHHQVPQPDQGAVWVGKQTNHDVPIQETCRFGSVLKRQQVTTWILIIKLIQLALPWCSPQWLVQAPSGTCRCCRTSSRSSRSRSPLPGRPRCQPPASVAFDFCSQTCSSACKFWNMRSHSENQGSTRVANNTHALDWMKDSKEGLEVKQATCRF